MLEGCVPWPDDVARRYREAGYWQGITLGDMLDETVATWGDRTAVVHGDVRLSYAELAAAVDRLALAFLEGGLKALDRVIFQLPNVPLFVTAFFALQKIGVIPVMALRAHRLNEIRHFAGHAGAVGYVIPDIVRSVDYREMARELSAELDHLTHVFVAGEAGPGQISIEDGSGGPLSPDQRTRLSARRPDPGEVALMLLSGGTTGLPKLIPRTHDDYIYNAKQSARALGFGPGTTFLILLPLAHNYNLAAPGLLGAISQGATVVLSDDISAQAVFPLIERESVSHVGAALPLIASWLNDPASGTSDLRTLKTMSNGGARLPRPLREGLEEKFGCTFVESYGTSEGLINQTRLDDPDEVRFESSGRPISPADEIRIVGEAGRELPDGEVGELLVRGPYTVRGYYRNPEADAKAFTSDGYYRMGDDVQKSAGSLYASGRQGDQINRGGEKIDCGEVEGHIHAHPAVDGVCIVAMPDQIYGEKACAFVTLKQDAELSLEDIKSFLIGRNIAKFKIPERLEVVAEFPLSPAGKILRRELRRHIEDTLTAET